MSLKHPLNWWISSTSLEMKFIRSPKQRRQSLTSKSETSDFIAPVAVSRPSNVTIFSPSLSFSVVAVSPCALTHASPVSVWAGVQPGGFPADRIPQGCATEVVRLQR